MTAFSMQRRDVEANVPPSDHSSVHTAVEGVGALLVSNLRSVPSSDKLKDPEKKDIANVKEKPTAATDEYQVGFEANDPEDPLNWSFMKKLTVAFGAILMIFNS